MAEEFVSIRMADLSSVEAYDLLASTIVPRPIAFVSTISSAGVANLAPFSFFMAGGSSPPSVMYSPTLNKSGDPKDSLRNVIETGEFVVNSVHRAMAAGMNAASYEFSADESEWEITGFNPLPSVAVKPARVLESFVQFECRLFQVVEHGTGANAARYVIGEVVYTHVNQAVSGNLADLRLISRLGGRYYADLDAMERFHMDRPPPTPPKT
jgi:flavin reductase (DIM6/NTAB) family NADH-FMN oxidoreductase RutF